MATTYLTSVEERQQTVFQRVERAGRGSLRSTHLSIDLQVRADRLRSARTQMISVHPQWANLHSGQVWTARLLCLVPLLAYALDYYLMGAVAEFFAQFTVSHPWAVDFAKLLIPAVLVFADLHVGVQLADARNESMAGNSRSGRVLFWGLVGFLLACVVPSATVAMYISNNVDLPAAINVLVLIGVIGASLTMHLSCIVAAPKILESFALVRFASGVQDLQRETSHAEDAARQHVRRAVQEFETYARGVAEIQREYPQAAFYPVTFDVPARHVIAEALGEDPFRAPRAGTYGGPAGTPPVSFSNPVASRPVGPIPGSGSVSTNISAASPDANPELRSEESEVRL